MPEVSSEKSISINLCPRPSRIVFDVSYADKTFSFIPRLSIFLITPMLRLPKSFSKEFSKQISFLFEHVESF